MQESFRLGKIWNIPIGFSSSWLLIFAFVTYSLAVGYMPQAYPQLDTPAYWILGAVTSVLFFGSVLFHELAHAWVALRYGVPVRRITLWLFGGVAVMDKEAPSAKAEFWIAIAGPISSLVAAAGFYGLFLLGGTIDWLAAPADYLFRINLILAVFNMIPAFPLDGGRVLRAIVWYFRDYRRGTAIAAKTGQVLAIGLISIGIFQMVTGTFFDGLWTAFIGWFIYSSAGAHNSHAIMQDALSSATVERVMQTQWQEVNSNTPVSLLVSEKIVRGGPRYYFVKGFGYGEDADKLNGMVTLTDITELRKDLWRITPVERLMTAWNRLVTTEPNVPLTDALRQMDERKINQMPVVRDETLVGVLTRENILHYLRLKEKFA